MVAGLERTFTGEVVGKDPTKWGADASWTSAELAKAKLQVRMVFLFLPRMQRVLQQYHQAT